MLLKLLVAVVLAFCADALSPISIKGAKLFDGQGKQFFLRGIDYTINVPPQDVLADAKRCQVDAGLMKSIGINSIRVYGVDVKNDHSSCMKTFESQGIYVWVDMSTPNHAMNRLTPTWDMDLYTQFTKVIDEFSRYDNTLLFGVGNELLTDPKYANTSIAYYLKAAARDVKQFQKKRGYRPIPLIYCEGKDGFNFSQQMSTYLACGNTRDTIDTYGINIYDWCNNSTYYSSGYDKLYGQFESLNIPVLFGETGCKPESGSRSFTGLSTILGPVFQNVFSGAVVYEWFNGPSGYGIVEYDDKHKSFPTTHEDFNKLSTVLATANPTGTSRAAYTPTNSAPACPTADPDSNWLVDPKKSLPVIAGLDIDTVTARTTWTANTEPTGARSGPDGASQSHSSKSSTSLSKGAIAGIAIGAVAGALVTAGVVAWLWFKKRKQMNQGLASEKTPTLSDDGTGRPELPAQSVGYVLPRQEMPASMPKSPVAINQEPQELGGDSVHEIGGAK